MRLRRTVAGVLFGLSLMVGAAWAQPSAPGQSADQPAGAARRLRRPPDLQFRYFDSRSHSFAEARSCRA